MFKRSKQMTLCDYECGTNFDVMQEKISYYTNFAGIVGYVQIDWELLLQNFSSSLAKSWKMNSCQPLRNVWPTKSWTTKLNSDTQHSHKQQNYAQFQIKWRKSFYSAFYFFLAFKMLILFCKSIFSSHTSKFVSLSHLFVELSLLLLLIFAPLEKPNTSLRCHSRCSFLI